jgi:hypothetical protein
MGKVPTGYPKSLLLGKVLQADVLHFRVRFLVEDDLRGRVYSQGYQYEYYL